MKKTYYFIGLFLAAGLLVVAGCASKKTAETLPVQEITIFKSSGCGCCSAYAQYMNREGFQVQVTDTEAMTDVKNKLKVPAQLQSCHTVQVGDYFVEGHVPMEAIAKLLSEQPDGVIGIAVQGMPSGSPGMPGPKTETWVVLAVHDDGSTSEFMRV